MSQPPPPIPYRSGPPAARPAAPSEFDHAYEQERGRWLRRRFLYYTGFSLTVSLLLAIPTIYILLKKRDEDHLATSILVLLVSTSATAAAFVIAWRSRPVYARILRLALASYLFASLMGVTFTHYYYLHAAEQFQAGVREGFSQASNDHSSRPRVTVSTTRAGRHTPSDDIFGGGLRYSYISPATTSIGSVRPTFTMPWAMDNILYGIIWTALLLSFTFQHFLISMFLPWTVRESMRPAVGIITVFLFMVLVDTFIGVAWWPFALAAAIILPFTFTPGTLVCWWRYSRFNRQFKQRFESQGFRKLQDELVGARRIHEANLPAPITDGPVRVAFDYEPMREIGGDLLMLHRSRAGDAVTAVLFDVTGHGVSAALSVNRIVGEIERTFAIDADASPEVLICNLNKYIHAILAKHQIYATAIVARVDAKAGTLEYVNAGHPPALLFGAYAVAKPLEPTAMMLGVCDGEDFPCEMLVEPIASGQAVVLYTDGASEAIDPYDRMLGIDGTHNAISGVAGERGDPASWPAAVHDFIVDHRQAPPTDDTLIVTMWRV